MSTAASESGALRASAFGDFIPPLDPSFLSEAAFDLPGTAAPSAGLDASACCASRTAERLACNCGRSRLLRPPAAGTLKLWAANPRCPENRLKQDGNLTAIFACASFGFCLAIPSPRLPQVYCRFRTIRGSYVRGDIDRLRNCAPIATVLRRQGRLFETPPPKASTSDRLVQGACLPVFRIKRFGSLLRFLASSPVEYWGFILDREARSWVRIFGARRQPMPNLRQPQKRFRQLELRHRRFLFGGRQAP